MSPAPTAPARVLPRATTRFLPPDGSAATAPAESRPDRSRADVRLLTVRPEGVRDGVFADLGAQLSPGDLILVNTSSTLPAALDGVLEDGRRRIVHVAHPLDDGRWVVEVRAEGNHGPETALRPGTAMTLPGGVRLTLEAPYLPAADRVRLWTAVPAPATPLAPYLRSSGRPVRYDYVPEAVPLSAYQTIFAEDGEPAAGSAEMPSAARPFTPELLARLASRGVVVAPVTLHTALASPESHEPPVPERFCVPASTAALVQHTRRQGGRVVAVGTTATRAVESATGPDGATAAAEGWTDLVLGPQRPPRVVDGLVSGLHDPEASHLLLLEAVAGADLVAAAYAHAVRSGYRWHEFGDAMLFLP